MIEKKWWVNKRPRTLQFEDDARLLDVLRDQLNLMGTKEGCGEGECGACSILLNDQLVLSCLQLAATVPNDAQIMTLEGMVLTPLGGRIRRGFEKAQAVQCGFCTPGMMMAAYALLAYEPEPTREQIQTAMAGNLCRCTGYEMIIEAVQAAIADKGW